MNYTHEFKRGTAPRTIWSHTIKPLQVSITSLLIGALAQGCGLSPYCLQCTEGGALPRDATVQDVATPDARGDGSMCVPSDAAELCNGVDDDCDGTIDEGFDLSSDLAHCGRCENACAEPNAELACRAGACVRTQCQEGFRDLDPEAPGCEYRCPVFPPAEQEECNGIDDDCDGRADEPERLRTPPGDLCRATESTPCAGTRPVCATRGMVTGWFCEYPAGVEYDRNVPNGIALEETRCDGVDNDCDGSTDEPFATLGRACSNDRAGACRDEGTIRCDPMDPARVVCDLRGGVDPVAGAPRPEVCNGVDDDCNGTVDDSDPADPARVREDMVRVRRGALDFWIYRHEASRPDATAARAGDLATRSCSRPGVLPWTNVGFDAAAAACAAAGLRLCTGAEWQAACEGAAASAYPYGSSYDPLRCNGGDRDAIPGGLVDHAVAPTGALAMCASADGALDLSGNVKEWTRDTREMTPAPMPRPIYVVRGGSFESPERGLTCQTDLSRATSDTALASLGFRCCSDRAP